MGSALRAEPFDAGATGNVGPLAAGRSAAATEQAPRWSELSLAEKATLKPLEGEWPTLSLHNKEKWRHLAVRFPKLSPERQARIQERMAAWTRLTPRERHDARLNFEAARQLPIANRAERWQAYEALPPERRLELLEQAERAERSRHEARAANLAKPPHSGRTEAAAGKPDAAGPRPVYRATLKPVTPAVVQVGPGATTTLINRRSVASPHPAPGQPTIAATSEFVDKATLLPQRGPQAATARSAAGAASAATAR